LSPIEPVNIPLLGQFIPDGIKPSTQLVVEFDPESQWLAVVTTIVSKWIQSGFRAVYAATSRPREEVINHLTRLGLDVAGSEKASRLRIDDWYSASLALERPTAEIEVIHDTYVRINSLKVADLSVDQLKLMKGSDVLSKWPESPGSQSDVLSAVESFSVILRFNEEKSFLDWMESRNLPLNRKRGRINLVGILRRLHSEYFYTRIENACDGIIDIRAMEREEEVKNLLRVRSLKGQPHDTRWHEIKITSSGEASLTTG